MEKLIERERELAAIDALLERGGGILAIEGRAGVGKTSLVDAACRQAEELGQEVLRARGSELEADFAFGVVRQLLERRLASADGEERAALLDGPAAAVRPLLVGQAVETPARDTSFAVLHGLYWLAANLAGRRPVLIAVDDAHWADEPSLRWLAYLAPRIEGLELSLLVALRPEEPALTGVALLALRAEAAMIVRPALLSDAATTTVVRAATGGRASDELCAAVWTASGGNPLYLTELLRATAFDDPAPAGRDPGVLLVAGLEGIARRVVARVRSLDPHALGSTCSPRRAGPPGWERCSFRPLVDGCGLPKDVLRRRSPTSRPAYRSSEPMPGAWRPARPATCTRARALRSRSCASDNPTAHANRPTPSWPMCAGSGCHARRGPRCVSPG